MKSGLRAARITCQLVRLCSSVGCHWSVENPRSSALWKWAPLQRALNPAPQVTIDFDMCDYGMPYKKPTRVVASAPELLALARSCRGGHTHVHLQGTVHWDAGGRRAGGWRSSLAAEYPAELCRRWARAALAAPPPGAGPPGVRRGADARDVHSRLLRWEAQLRAAASVGERAVVVPRCPDGNPAPWPAAAAGWGTRQRWVPPRAPLQGAAR